MLVILVRALHSEGIEPKRIFCCKVLFSCEATTTEKR